MRSHSQEWLPEKFQEDEKEAPKSASPSKSRFPWSPQGGKEKPDPINYEPTPFILPPKTWYNAFFTTDGANPSGTANAPFDTTNTAFRATSSISRAFRRPKQAVLPPSYPNDEHRWQPTRARPDRQTRWTTLALIGDVMHNDKLAPNEVVDILTDLEEACRKDSVPFSELLHENVEGAGAAPLLLEIIRSDLERSEELLEFLAKKTSGPKVSWMVRHGCRINGNNELFQNLRDVLGERPSYTVTLEEQSSGFSVTLGIDNLAGELEESQRYTQQSAQQFEKAVIPMDYRRNKAIELEWVVGGRAWSLEITQDLLSLALTEGAPCIVSASVITIPEASHGNENDDTKPLFFEVAFPALSLLRPLSGSGVHRISATIPWGTPSFPKSFDELIFGMPRIGFLVNAQVEELGPQTIGDPFFETSGIDDVNWENVSTSNPFDDENWILASWQGKDEDAA